MPELLYRTPMELIGTPQLGNVAQDQVVDPIDPTSEATIHYTAGVEEATSLADKEAEPLYLGTVVSVHFRGGNKKRTDGISLRNWDFNEKLAELGWRVIEVTSDAERKTDRITPHPVPVLEYDTERVKHYLRKRDVEEGRVVRTQTPEDEYSDFLKDVALLEKEFQNIIDLYNPSVMTGNNIACLSIHPAALVAWKRTIVNNPQVAFLNQNHDPECVDEKEPDDRKRQYEMDNLEIQKLIDEAMLPQGPNVVNAAINTITQRVLEEKLHEPIALVTDAVDFNLELHEIEDFYEKLGLTPNDKIRGFTQRTIPRKGIEVGLAYAAEIHKHRQELIKAGVMTEDGRDVVILCQRDGLDELNNALYFKALVKYAESLGYTFNVGSVDPNLDPSTPVLLYIGDRVASGEFRLFDLYRYFRRVMYPSYEEGLGNNALEAWAYCIWMLLLHNYPVNEDTLRPVYERSGEESGVLWLGDSNDDYVDGETIAVELGDSNDGYVDGEKIVEVKLRRLVEGKMEQAVKRELALLLAGTEGDEKDKALAARTRERLQKVFDLPIVVKGLSDLLHSAIEKTQVNYQRNVDTEIPPNDLEFEIYNINPGYF